MANYPYAKPFTSDPNALEANDTRLDDKVMSEVDLEATLVDESPGDDEVSRHLSIVGQTLVFKGELSAEEDLLIQGRVQGSIQHNATTLTIGAHGDVEADIVARRIIVQGKVKGDMRASESITIETSARVQGNLFAPRIGIKEGAKFKGSIDMDVPPKDSPSPRNKRPTPTKAKGARKATGAKADETLADAEVDRVLE